MLSRVPTCSDGRCMHIVSHVIDGEGSSRLPRRTSGIALSKRSDQSRPKFSRVPVKATDKVNKGHDQIILKMTYVSRPPRRRCTVSPTRSTPAGRSIPEFFRLFSFLILPVEELLRVIGTGPFELVAPPS